MAMSLDSTIKNMINTTENTRLLAHQFMNSPTPGAPLTNLQLRLLLNSPLGSILKNTLYASMMYCLLLEKIREHQIELILEKLGLKKEMRRLYDLLLRAEDAAYHARMAELEEEYELENQPKPIVMEKLTLDLKSMTHQLSILDSELESIHLAQMAIQNDILNEHKQHIALVQHLALHPENPVTLTDEQIAIVVPHAHKIFNQVLTPQEQIKALGMFNREDGDVVNNLANVKKFLTNVELKKQLHTYENRMGVLNNDLSDKNNDLTQAKMKALALQERIALMKEVLDKVTKLPDRPVPGINADALEELANQKPTAKRSR